MVEGRMTTGVRNGVMVLSVAIEGTEGREVSNHLERRHGGRVKGVVAEIMIIMIWQKSVCGDEKRREREPGTHDGGKSGSLKERP
jgi:hypothetical protein